MYLFLLIMLNIILLPMPSFAEEDQPLERIVIKRGGGNRYSSFKGADSVYDALNHSPGVDLRCRGSRGTQGDLSIRGSTYEQVLILIDGVRINDPQTGHHNLDIPLTPSDIENITIIKRGASSLHGAGALGGSVNIITKKPIKKTAALEMRCGEHALYEQAVSIENPGRDYFTTFSLEHSSSSGGRPNTDFEYATLSSLFGKEWDNHSLDGIFGYQKKDFGADSFYSNLFPEEKEETRALFTKLGLSSSKGSSVMKNTAFLRKHEDTFWLRRHAPASFNRHTVYSYGISSSLDAPIKIGDIHLGADMTRDEINSTNLGKNTRLNEAGSVGFSCGAGERLSVNSSLRIDHYQNWKNQNSSNISMSYWIIRERLRLNSGFGRAFRVPSFTELYYSDAANIGNPDLKPEKSDSYTLGLESKNKHFNSWIEGFARGTRNTIDWTRPSALDPWRATNLGAVDFRGIELGLEVKDASLTYVYTEADRGPVNYLSKYALDILKQQVLLNLENDIRGVSISLRLSYNERKFGETYFTGDISAGRPFKKSDCEIEPFIKIDNFTDTEYSEISGVTQPGRWMSSGIKIKW
ncbi:MAG: TonB-dependent receptor [Candidatus Omnitrophota bacterium]